MDGLENEDFEEGRQGDNRSNNWEANSFNAGKDSTF